MSTKLDSDLKKYIARYEKLRANLSKLNFKERFKMQRISLKITELQKALGLPNRPGSQERDKLKEEPTKPPDEGPSVRPVSTGGTRKPGSHRGSY